MLNSVHDDSCVKPMPDVSDVFATGATFAQSTTPTTKTTGGSDSVRNSKSRVKAPGGKDAAKQKDGG